MRPLGFTSDEAVITIADALFALGLPPTTYASVEDWNDRSRPSGVVPEFRLEIWANASTNLSSAQLYSARKHPLVVADDEFVGEADDDTLTATGHGLLTGDGPVRVSNAGGALPGGLVAATDYWVIRVDDDVFKLATSFANAVAGTAVALSTDGTGTQTLSDTASTERVHWHALGLLGPAGDGAITLTNQLAYATRLQHDPATIAYALSASLSASDPEAVSAHLIPLQDH